MIPSQRQQRKADEGVDHTELSEALPKDEQAQERRKGSQLPVDRDHQTIEERLAFQNDKHRQQIADEVQGEIAEHRDDRPAGQDHTEDRQTVEEQVLQQPAQDSAPKQSGAGAQAVDQEDDLIGRTHDKHRDGIEQQAGDGVGHKVAGPGHGEGVHHIGGSGFVQILEDHRRAEDGHDEADAHAVFLETLQILPDISGPCAEDFNPGSVSRKGIARRKLPQEQKGPGDQENGQQATPQRGKTAGILPQQGRIKE